MFALYNSYYNSIEVAFYGNLNSLGGGSLLFYSDFDDGDYLDYMLDEELESLTLEENWEI